jgi:hypothetical protein
LLRQIDRRSEMMREAEETKAFAYANDLLVAAIDVVGAASIEITENWKREPKIIGLTLSEHIQFQGGIGLGSRE